MPTEDISQQLASDLFKEVGFINDFLAVVNAKKMSLKEKVRAVKNQIQDDISLYLDLLRHREVWLLEQVDILAQLKEESIESNEKEVSALLAKLEVYQEVLQTTTLGQNPEVALRVRKALSNIQNEKLSTEESTDIYFFVHNFALSDAIKNFGEVTEKIPEKVLPGPGSDQVSVMDDTAHLEIDMAPSQSKRQISRQLFSGTKDLTFIQEHFDAVLSSPTSEWLVTMSDPVNKSKSGTADVRVIARGMEELSIDLKPTDAKEWLYKEDQAVDVELTTTQSFSLNTEKIKTSPLVSWVRPDPAASSTNEALNVMQSDSSGRSDSWFLTREFFSQTQDELNPIDEKLLRSNKEDGEKDYNRSEQAKKGGDFTGDINKWLLNAKNVDEDRFLPDQMKLGEKASSQNWLLTRDSSKSSGELATKGENWLQKSRESLGKSTSVLDSLIVSGSESEYWPWLARDSIDRCKDCSRECAKETFKISHDFGDSCRNKWLATTTD